MLLPRIIAQYRSLKIEAARRQQHQRQGGAVGSIHPLSLRSAVVLSLVAGAAVAWLLSAGLLPQAVSSRLPLLPAALGVPENIFVATQSRLQAPTDVLFTRLANSRPDRVLTPADQALRLRLGSLQARLLYLQFGPGVMADCPFCSVAADAPADPDPSAYLYYALVDVLAGHIANLVIIAVVTSPLLLLGRRGAGPSTKRARAQLVSGMDPSGSEADYAYDVAAAAVRRWRAPASMAALALAALDVYLVATYDRQANARATRLADIDPFFWTMRAYRGVAAGALLGFLGVVLYWAATGWYSSPRLGLLGVLLYGSPAPPSPAHRVTAVTRTLAGVKSKLSAAAIVKNTALRDADLRSRTQAYWAREVLLVAEAMEEREVIEGVNDALQNRIDMRRIEQDAELYAQNVVPSTLAGPGPDETGAGTSDAGPAAQESPQPEPQVIRSRSSTPVAAGGGTATRRK